MSNDKIIERVHAYQNSELSHPLTCGNNSMHQILQPMLLNNKVMLFCKDCSYLQRLPEMFLKDDFDSYISQIKSVNSVLKEKR